MTIKIAIAAMAVLTCAACANQSPMQPMALGFHGQLESTPADSGVIRGGWVAATEETAVEPDPRMKQTLGGKVLSAIALERVTGRKPDPSRFNDLH